MIVIKNLGLKINSQTIFESINCEFNKGQIVNISGKNGTGKTSFLKCILSIYTDFDGDITINNEINIDTLPYIKNIKQSISFLFNDFLLYQNLTMQENIKVFNSYFQQNAFRPEITQLIFDFGLKSYYNVKVNKLSDGNKQKLRILITLMKDAEYYILDEPIKNLDSESIKGFYQLIKVLQSKYNNTFLIVSHNDSILSEIATNELNFDKNV